MPPDARARLDEGVKTLFSLQLGERQLSAAQRSLLDRAKALSTGHGCVTLAMGLLLTPFFLFSVYAFFSLLLDGDIGFAVLMALVCLPCLAVFVGLSWFGRRQVHRPIERLRLACAATPPSRPGDPAECHVCGGPVPSSAGQAVARCAYCSADNLVDAAALRAGAARRASDLGDIGGMVTREARALGGVALSGYMTAIGAIVAIPVVGFLCLVMAFIVAMQIELPPVALTYVVVESGKRKCLAELQDGKANFHGNTPAGFPAVPPIAGHEQIAAAKLAGRTLEDGRKIVKMVSHPPSANFLVLDNGSELAPSGACLR